MGLAVGTVIAGPLKEATCFGPTEFSLQTRIARIQRLSRRERDVRKEVIGADGDNPLAGFRISGLHQLVGDSAELKTERNGKCL